MKNQMECNATIVRSGTRARESVRSLPKGHFQQIRQMFEKPTNSTKKLSPITERKQKSLPPDVLFRLPVTDDEKLKHSTNKIDCNKSLNERYRNYMAEYQSFRLKLTNELLEHRKRYPNKADERLLMNEPVSLTQENSLKTEILIHNPSLSTQQQNSYSLSKTEDFTTSESTYNKHRQSAMSTLANYTNSYDSSTSSSLNRTGSSRKYVTSLNNPPDIHTEPVITTTTTIPNFSDDNQLTMSHESGTFDLLKDSRRLHSSTSLSSTGYDSNSSPSIKSKRNSIATSNSNDCIIHSTCSSSPSSSPSSSRNKQEHEHEKEGTQLPKPWIPHESNTINPSCFTSYFNDDVFESSNEPSPMISRTEIKLSQPTAMDQRPTNTVRHAVVRNTTLKNSSSSSAIHEPAIAPKTSNQPSFIVQTTSFPENKDKKVDKKIRRWNNFYPERTEFMIKGNRPRKFPLLCTQSLGFPVVSSSHEEQQQQTNLETRSSNSEQKQNHESADMYLNQIESPALHKLPPKKPPRTFEHGRKHEPLTASLDTKIQSAPSSNDNTSALDLGSRSISCMDLTASASNTISSNDRVLLTQEQNRQSFRSEKTSHTYEPLKVPLTPTIHTNNNETFLYNSSQSEINTMHKITPFNHLPTTKIKGSKKSNMKKGISEPNLTNSARNKSPFSPRGLLDRVKRLLPISLSKQSLFEKTNTISDNNNKIQNDSDDTGSMSSENNDDLRTSRLDHVSRVRNIYDSLSSSNNMSTLLTDPNLRLLTKELTTLYDYVVHILPEQDIGYFSNGTGCLVTSSIHRQPISKSSTSVRFKYPLHAQDEATLKYFCFPEQHDSNNNPLIIKKTNQEYFRFTLTNMLGLRQYGYCSRFFHKGTLNALCIISPYDMIEVYEKILATATELFLSYKDNEAKKFLEEIYHHRLPNRGEAIHISTSTVGLYTLKCEFDRRKVLIDSIALLSLSTDTIIKIFSSILYEQKLIFIGNELGTLTRLINTFVCLLYPFSWPHTYVPILPALMLDIVQAPTPYIIGILRSCEPYLSSNDDLLLQDNSDILIVDIDHDRIRSIGDYLASSVYRNSTENLHHAPASNLQILPNIFKIELKQEISILRKNRSSLSLEECQQRLHEIFMSIFVQSCYNYRDYFDDTFYREEFLKSKQHTVELFLEWFTRTQIFELFIRQKFEYNNPNQYALTFDVACEKYLKTKDKQTPQRRTAKEVKRKSASRANKLDNRL